MIDLEEALPAVTLGVRVGDNIYFLSTKNTMLTYNTGMRYKDTLKLFDI